MADQRAPHEDWIDVMRLVAVFLVVVVHVVNPDKQLGHMPANTIGWFAIDALTAATRWALPVFVMISGYLLLDPHKALDWNTYFHRRMRRIAWPLVAWTCLYLALSMSNSGLRIAEVPRLLLKGAPYYHLWYIYMLPGLYLVCPFIKLATDRMSPAQLAGAVALCFATTILSACMDALYSVPNVTYIDDFPRYLGYFLAGHLLGRVLPLPKLTHTFALLVVAFLALAGAAYIVAQAYSPTQAMRLFGFGNPAIVLLSLAAFALLRRISVTGSWRVCLVAAGETSFGIYLVHPAVIDIVQDWIAPISLRADAVVIVLGLLISGLVVLAMQQTPILRRCV